MVLLSGLGDGLKIWNDIAVELSAHTGVFSYDRPGYGGSSDVFHGRDGCDGRYIATHLKTCLDAARIPPPYVLAGHLIGGLYALDFIAMYRTLVSGLVQMDSRMPAFSAECLRQNISAEPPWYLKLLFPRRLKAKLQRICDTRVRIKL